MGVRSADPDADLETALADFRKARRRKRVADVHWIDALYQAYLTALLTAQYTAQDGSGDVTQYIPFSYTSAGALDHNLPAGIDSSRPGTLNSPMSVPISVKLRCSSRVSGSATEPSVWKLNPSPTRGGIYPSVIFRAFAAQPAARPRDDYDVHTGQSKPLPRQFRADQKPQEVEGHRRDSKIVKCKDGIGEVDVRPP